MANFAQTEATVGLPKPKAAGTGERIAAREEYKAALQDAIANGRTLTIAAGPDDKLITIKNRIMAAGKALGFNAVSKPQGLPNQLFVRRVRGTDSFTAAVDPASAVTAEVEEAPVVEETPATPAPKRNRGKNKTA